MRRADGLLATRAECAKLASTVRTAAQAHPELWDLAAALADAAADVAAPSTPDPEHVTRA